MRFCLLVLLLAGCATQWKHPQPGVGPGITQAELTQCSDQAQYATANMPSGMERGARLAELTNLCMSRKGYYK